MYFPPSLKIWLRACQRLLTSACTHLRWRASPTLSLGSRSCGLSSVFVEAATTTHLESDAVHIMSWRRMFAALSISLSRWSLITVLLAF